MSRSYKTNDPDVPHFITFAVVEWVDVFTRKQYLDILIDSIQYCQKEKGLSPICLVYYEQSCAYDWKGKGQLSAQRYIEGYEKVYK